MVQTGTFMNSILSNLVGKPYESGAHGPDKFDCWGLIVYIYKELLDIELPEYAGFESKKKYPGKMRREIFKADSDWQIIDKPEPYCVIAMSRTKTINHVGIWIPINHGICFHAVEGESVLGETMQRLKMSGFGKMLFLRYKHK